MPDGVTERVTNELAPTIVAFVFPRGVDIFEERFGNSDIDVCLLRVLS